MVTRSPCTLWVASLLSAWSATGTAQRTEDSTAARGAILGAVTDTALQPIAGVSVNVVGMPIRLVTGSTGRFLIGGLPTGHYLLTIRRFTYQPLITLAEVRSNDTLRLAAMLEPTANVLQPVVVNQPSASARAQDFEERRRRGIGEFFTQDDIEKRNPVSLIDLLRQSKTLRLIAGPKSGQFSAESGRQWWCFMQVYVDGVPLAAASDRPTNTPFDLTQLPTPSQILGIEIYSGAATIPMNLPPGPQPAHSGCGVVLLWTKDGL